MHVRIVSDVHIGSRYFLRARFLEFLDALPPGCDLVLNGDTLESTRRTPGEADRRALERLCAESLRRRIVWLPGNHDRVFTPPPNARFEFATEWAVGRRLLVRHAFGSGRAAPGHTALFAAVRFLYRIRVRLGAESVHIAHYAKRFGRVYGVLCRRVRRNAVRAARARGFEAVACGHTHLAEDTLVNGIRFLNPGAWTEDPVQFIELDDAGIRLVPFAPRQ